MEKKLKQINKTKRNIKCKYSQNYCYKLIIRFIQATQRKAIKKRLLTETSVLNRYCMIITIQV